MSKATATKSATKLIRIPSVDVDFMRAFVEMDDERFALAVRLVDVVCSVDDEDRTSAWLSDVAMHRPDLLEMLENHEAVQS